IRSRRAHGRVISRDCWKIEAHPAEARRRPSHGIRLIRPVRTDDHSRGGRLVPAADRASGRGTRLYGTDLFDKYDSHEATSPFNPGGMEVVVDDFPMDVMARMIRRVDRLERENRRSRRIPAVLL